MPLSRTAVRTGRSTGSRSFGSYMGTVFATQPASAPPSTSTAASSSALTLQRWLTEHQITLQESQDRDALARLSKGDTSYFIAYSERRLAEQTDQDQISYWRGLHDEAIAKAEDNYVSGAVASGELKLEDALSLLVQRRKKTSPGDASFVSINQQIAQIHNAIDARDFNALVSRAYGEFVDTGDKQKYLTALVGFKGLAKDDTARKALDTQITGLRTEIQKDQQVKAQAEVDKRFIDYYSNGKASDLLNYLSDKAGSAKTAAEADYYVSLAGKVVAREEALTKQRVTAAGKAGAGASSTAQKKAIDNALQPARNDLADAVDHLQSITRNGQVPTASDWAIYWAAGDKVLAGDQAALAAGATGANLDAVLKEQRAVIEQRDIQKKAAGEQVLRKMDDIKTVISKLAADAKNTTGDITTAADLAARQIRALEDLAGSDFLKGTESAVTAQEKITLAKQPFAAAYQDAIGALTDPTQRKSFKQATALYDAYVKKYDQKIGDGGQVSFDRWQEVMASGADANTIAGYLGLGTADGTNNGFTLADVDAALKTRTAASAEKEQLVRTIVQSGKIVPDLIGQNSVALGLFGYAGGGRVVPGYNAPAISTSGGPRPANPSLISGEMATRPINEVSPFDSGVYAPPERAPRAVNDVAPFDTGAAYDPYAPTRPVNDVGPFDSGQYAPSYPSYPTRPVQDVAPWSPPQLPAPPGGGGYTAGGYEPGFDAGFTSDSGASSSPQSPDAASRNLDTILGTATPAWQNAFDYLSADTPLNLPSWEIPDLPEEPSFMPSGTNTFDAGFTEPVPVIDQGMYAGDTTGVTHGH